jgi:anti-anti-sigma regulatory factor
VAGTGWQHVDHQGRRIENPRVHIEVLRSRSLGLIGALGAEDKDQLVEAMSTLGPDGPITLDFKGVTSIDEGGVEALRQAINRARDRGEVVLTLVVSSSGVVDELRAGGLDEDPMILIEIVEP